MKLLLLCILLSVSFAAWPQQTTSNTTSPLKGQRPLIDLSKVPASAYEAGKVSLKFKQSFAALLRPRKENGIYLFGIEKVDRLNRFFKVGNGVRSFQMPSIPKEELHTRWGFHLWYEIEMPSSSNIRKVVEEYLKTGFFDVAEPLYRVEETGIKGKWAFAPNDTRFNDQWNLKNTGQANGTAGKDINVSNAWDIEKGRPEVIVAMIDRGIQYSHPDLAKNMWQGIGYNFVTNSSILTPEDHGTAAAGIVGAISNNSTGISGIAGGDGTVNSGIRLMSCQIFEGSNTNGNIAQALVWAADHGACIASNSWVYTAPGVYRQSVLDAIDYFCNYGGGNVLQGGIVVAAAGNNGEERLTYPSCYERVIGVAATTNKDIKSDFSSYGDWVDIVAPAGDASLGPSDIPTTSTNGYTFFSGTSASSPHVAGVAALVASKLMGRASASDVRNILLSTTDDIYPLNPNYAGKLGTGRLNAFRALQKAEALLAGNTVAAPASFTCNGSCGSIELNWTKGNASNDVIIAFSNSSSIGIPANGTSYIVGNSITGGGTVIYKGNASSFSFPIPNNNVFQYFKIWSVNGSNQYSFGRQLDILTGPVYPISDNSSYEEGFEGLTFPYQSLRTGNPDNGITWARTDLVRHGGSICAFIRNFEYAATKEADTMYLPQLKPNNADSIKLSFWMAYKAASKVDSLLVLASFDCGKSYQTIWAKAGNDLATVTGSQGTAFLPVDADWKKQDISFGIPANTEKVSIAFKGINGNGQNLYIDDIAVSTKTLPQKLKADGLLVSPNPFSKQLTVQHYLPPANLKTISIFSSTGQKVYGKSFNGNAASLMVLDLSKLAKGAYHVRFDYNDSSTIKKVVKL